MSEHEETKFDPQREMVESQPGPEGAGLAPIPEPSQLPSAYGIDEAVAIAVVPERALIFWELATVIEANAAQGVEFRLIRLRLASDKPEREAYWQIGPIGRFQDSGLTPGAEYLYVISRTDEGEEIPLLVTNPIRMPLRKPVADTPGDMPSSLYLIRPEHRRKLKEEA